MNTADTVIACDSKRLAHPATLITTRSLRDTRVAFRVCRPDGDHRVLGLAWRHLAEPNA